MRIYEKIMQIILYEFFFFFVLKFTTLQITTVDFQSLGDYIVVRK